MHTTLDVLAMTCQTHKTSSAEKCAEVCRVWSFTYGGKHMLLCNLPKLGILVIQKSARAEKTLFPDTSPASRGILQEHFSIALGHRKQVMLS